jgi:transcriptional regulator with XRE-family HTH domain
MAQPWRFLVYAKPSPDPMSSMWAWIAYDLRFYRVKHRMSGEDFGKIMGVVRSTVSRMESGEYRLKEDHARALDKYFNTGGHFFRLVWYARLGHDPDWFKEHVGRESMASVLKIFEHSTVPGLFQTEAYARAVFTIGGVKDVDAEVATRLARQAALTREDPPLIWLLLNQAAIDLPVGSPKVMREQLGRLLELSELPDVMLRVVPRSAGWHLGMEGAFKIMTVGREDAAYVEACGGGRLVLDATEVRAYGLRFDRIGTEALTPGATQSLIKEVMESLT